MIRKKLDVLCYMHEIFHYLPAKIFDLDPEMHPTSTTFALEKANDWQIMIITLMPAYIGSIWLLIAFYFQYMELWIISVFWMAACWFDFVNVYKYLKNGSWDEIEVGQ